MLMNNQCENRKENGECFQRFTLLTPTLATSCGQDERGCSRKLQKKLLSYPLCLLCTLSVSLGFHSQPQLIGLLTSPGPTQATTKRKPRSLGPTSPICGSPQTRAYTNTNTYKTYSTSTKGYKVASGSWCVCGNSSIVDERGSIKTHPL